ncbi:MAG: SMC-Scp complex subunit ScpB [Candidatus Micrarchaeota archaeon]|nr:SMC-Scp complex subunit ScpB [Candidatus Micrarchaeota archaeon]
MEQKPDEPVETMKTAAAAETAQEPLEQGEEEAEGELSEETESLETNPEPATANEQPAAGQEPEEVEEETGKTPLDPLRIVEAALFLANKPLAIAELALIAKTTVKQAQKLVEQLAAEFGERNSSIEVLVENNQISLQVKPAYLAPVAGLSKETGLSRKATRILALVAKKEGMLQSELKNFFRGEIYAYVTELKTAGYLTAEKKGNTRLLKPTKKFNESFQLSA